MVNKLKSLIQKNEVKQQQMDYKDFYSLYFYALADSRISVKGRKMWKWYSIIPASWVKKGVPIVRTQVKLDCRDYNCNTTILGHVITIDHEEKQRQLVNTAIKVKTDKIA